MKEELYSDLVQANQVRAITTRTALGGTCCIRAWKLIDSLILFTGGATELEGNN